VGESDVPTHPRRVVGKIDPLSFRQTLGRFLSGVTVVSTVDPETGVAHGMTASAFLSVSLDPPLVLVSLDRRSRLLDVMRRAQRCGISILDEHQEAVARHFAGSPQDLPPRLCRRSGAVVLDDSLAYVVIDKCDLRAAGDHELLLGEIVELGFKEEGTPLAYFGGQFYRIGPTEADVLVAWPSHGEPIWM
jgi:flavin reductase (DIM6/NTAB) family NADH-FMN oxidoreductase RutF